MKRAPFFIILLAFIVNTFGPLPSQADEFRLPAPGVRVRLSPPLEPPILKGIKVHADNPFRFDFILDQGDGVIARSEATKQSFIKQESTKLIKYFLASLTIPEKDLWVNLSPYEKDRIISSSFGLTEMGRDLLAEDYMLKQITASLIYPEDEVGKKFWKRIYAEAAQKFHTTNIPVNTFNKVWIVPEKAVVYENAKAGTAYVVEAKLKVMLEQDYLSLSRHVIPAKGPYTGHSQLLAGIQSNNISTLGSQIIREIVIPELTKEVNEDKNFAQLRQVYNSLILATWYKKKIKDSILEQVYADKNKTAGIQYASTVIPASARGGSAFGRKAGIQDNNVEAIYYRYLQAFKKGVYNYIKEEQDPLTQQAIPRKYFSGGIQLFGKQAQQAMIVVNDKSPISIRKNIRKFISAVVGASHLLMVVGCTITPEQGKNSALTQEFKVGQFEIKMVNIKKYWPQIFDEVGHLGMSRLSAIIDLNDFEKIPEGNINSLKQMAIDLKKMSEKRFTLLKKAFHVQKKPLSQNKFFGDYYKYVAITGHIKSRKDEELFEIVQSLFRYKENLFNNNPDIFDQFLNEAKYENVDSVKSLLAEFPQLFDPSIDYSRPLGERLAPKIAKIRSLPPFSTVVDPQKTGFEAYNNPSVNQLLRRYLLAVLDFYQVFAPLNQERKSEATFYDLFAKVTEDSGGWGSDSQGRIGFKTLEQRSLPAFLGHETGHNLALFGIYHKVILMEFVADIYAYLLNQKMGDLLYKEAINSFHSKVFDKIFLERMINIIIYGQDPSHDDHYYARKQIEYIQQILGEKNIDWESMFFVLRGIEKDYENDTLKPEVRAIIDSHESGSINEIVDLGSFAFEMLTRYLRAKGKSAPSEYQQEDIDWGYGIHLKLMRALPGKQTVLVITPPIKVVYVENNRPSYEYLLSRAVRSAVDANRPTSANFNAAMVIAKKRNEAKTHRDAAMQSLVNNSSSEENKVKELEMLELALHDFRNSTTIFGSRSIFNLITLIDSARQDHSEAEGELKNLSASWANFITHVRNLQLLSRGSQTAKVEWLRSGFGLFEDHLNQLDDELSALVRQHPYIAMTKDYTSLKSNKENLSLFLKRISEAKTMAGMISIKRENLNRVVLANIGIQKEFKNNSYLIYRPSDGGPYVFVLFNPSHEAEDVDLDALNFGRVITSLVINATEALLEKKSGRRLIRITTAIERKPENANGPEKDWVNITIADNGPGMNKEISDRIFEKGFSTKERSGRGLGLFGVREIIRAHGGEISVQSRVGRGTTFTISLLMRGDSAQTATARGGIDFTANKVPLRVKTGSPTKAFGDDNSIRFHLDPAQLSQLQNAPGFTPVIINIQPLKSLPEFLGIAEKAGNSSGVG